MSDQAEWSETWRDPKPIIQEMVRRIAERFHPERIILFGSHATGRAGPDSDVDLLVVMRGVEGRRRKTATAIDMALTGIDLPTDILVVTPEDVERGRQQISTVIYPALREGRVLYDAAA